MITDLKSTLHPPPSTNNPPCKTTKLFFHISKPFREIQNEIQRITNFKYDRKLRFGKKNPQGGFKGFMIKQECLIKIDEEE